MFISPDPLLDPSRPKSINPYAYGHGNPSTNTDKSGLAIPVGARSNAVVWHAKFQAQDSSRVGAFAGNRRAMIDYGIKPRSVSRRQYKTDKPAYDATPSILGLPGQEPRRRRVLRWASHTSQDARRLPRRRMRRPLPRFD